MRNTNKMEEEKHIREIKVENISKDGTRRKSKFICRIRKRNRHREGIKRKNKQVDKKG